MELKHVALVIVDISGYTAFLRRRNLTLLHAEEIISQLLESVIDAAEYPLTLNKLEGDAAFLYAIMEEDYEKIAKDILQQIRNFFPVFQRKADELAIDASYCDCDACTHIELLRLKAFLHHGEVVIKKIRQFEELAGENVILIHRLLKNGVNKDEYILLTEDFSELTGDIPELQKENRTEIYEKTDPIPVTVFYPTPPIPPLDNQPYTPKKRRMLNAQFKRLLTHSLGKDRDFKHIPNEKVSFIAYFREMKG